MHHIPTLGGMYQIEEIAEQFFLIASAGHSEIEQKSPDFFPFIYFYFPIFLV